MKKRSQVIQTTLNVAFMNGSQNTLSVFSPCKPLVIGSLEIHVMTRRFALAFNLLNPVGGGFNSRCSILQLLPSQQNDKPKFPLMTRNKIDCFMMKALF